MVVEDFLEASVRLRTLSDEKSTCVLSLAALTFACHMPEAGASRLSQTCAFSSPMYTGMENLEVKLE